MGDDFVQGVLGDVHAIEGLAGLEAPPRACTAAFDGHPASAASSGRTTPHQHVQDQRHILRRHWSARSFETWFALIPRRRAPIGDMMDDSENPEPLPVEVTPCMSDQASFADSLPS